MNLIELLFAMAALGILAGFIFPTIARTRTGAKVVRAKMMMNQVMIALDMYHNDYHTYPDTLESLSAIGISIETLPKDPFNPDEDYFQYYTNKYPYQGSTYVPEQLFLISSFGPDKDNDVFEKTMENNDATGYFLGPQYGYDSSVYEFYEVGGDDNYDLYSLDATTQPGYEDGDLILFGPRQPKGLKEVDYGGGFDTWANTFGF